MPSSIESIDAASIEVPPLPDFNRLPFRPPEEAVYRDPENLPAGIADNPLYLALPGPRTMAEVKQIMEAANPVFDPKVRELPAILRREHIDVVDPAVFAIRRHIRLEDMIMSTIRNSFARRTWHNLYIEEAAARANLVAPLTRNWRGASVGAGSLFGDVGLGKSLSVICNLMACPQTIKHSIFRGRRLGILQVVWLYLSMPPKASAYGLLAWIASILDSMLGTSYRDDVDKARNHTAQVRVVARALAIHAVGVIFCDEVQNLRVGSTTERRVFENTLQELINYTHTRWVFIGTRQASASIQSDALLRRMCGERGRITWAPLEPGPEWTEFLTRLWKWQVTRSPTTLAEEIPAEMYRLTGGVPDYAKRLFTAAQANIIGNPKQPDEQLTMQVLRSTMQESFPDEYARFSRRYRLREARLARGEREQPGPIAEPASKP